ncbi:MAG: ATP-binding cassette domain-containing protein [Proteobacteria bacterium]|nr:ATP-binding cassette domain-containing protein [Pseudomonadota bacterium]
MDPREVLLSVENLHKTFPVYKGIFRREVARVFAVGGVSFDIYPQETVGIVGESGCGKSTLGKTIMRLYDADKGSVKFRGQDLGALKGAALREMRRHIQMIFQDPLNSLNARFTVSDVIKEPFDIHGMRASRAEMKERIQELLNTVGLHHRSANRYPHEFSGGQCQRIGIARALALRPSLLICDEPVSALDVSIQSQVINLLLRLQDELKLSYIFIAHDLTVVRHVSDRVIVMYLGEVVEYSTSEALYDSPYHPYTKALISAIPTISAEKTQRHPLVGEIPSPMQPPSGCRFHTRCPFAEKRCSAEKPELRVIDGDSQHVVACHFAEKLAGASS